MSSWIVSASPSTKQAAERLSEIDLQCNSPAWSGAMFFGGFRADHTWTRVIGNESGEILGFLVAQVVLDEAHIQNLGVHPSARRRGCARALVATFIRELHDRGVQWLTLEVRIGNTAARKLYESFGFFESGRRLGYYDNGTEDALVLRLSVLDAITRGRRRPGS